MSRSSRVQVFRTIVIGLVTCAPLGCAPPAVVYRPASDVVADEKGQPLSLTLTTGERYIISGASVRNDTLYAVQLGVEMSSDTRLVVPVSRIVSLARTERGLDAGGAGAIGLVVGALFGALFIIGLLAGLS